MLKETINELIATIVSLKAEVASIEKDVKVGGADPNILEELQKENAALKA